MLDQEGKVLVDGRNRLAACKLAKVDPVFDRLPAGRDPLSYIATVNLIRRNLTKGQKAMATAMIYPEPDERGRGKKSIATKSAETAGFSQRRLNVAREVLRYSRPLAESVLKGITTLDDALAKVKAEQQYQSSDESKLARLQKSAPDLAEQVNEERLKINEAIAALQAREQEIKRVCEYAAVRLRISWASFAVVRSPYSRASITASASRYQLTGSSSFIRCTPCS